MEVLLQMFVVGVGLGLIHGLTDAQRTTATKTFRTLDEELQTLKSEINALKSSNNELEERIGALERTRQEESECKDDRPSCRTSCPAGWEHHSHNRTSKSCYLFNTTKVNWHEASGQCIHSSNNTATLVTINSMNENSYLTARLRESFWIGMHYESTGRKWQWYNGEPVGYTYWRAGQPPSPPSPSSARRCVVGNYFGEWYVYPCTLKKPFICEMTLQASCAEL